MVETLGYQRKYNWTLADLKNLRVASIHPAKKSEKVFGNIFFASLEARSDRSFSLQKISEHEFLKANVKEIEIVYVDNLAANIRLRIGLSLRDRWQLLSTTFHN